MNKKTGLTKLEKEKLGNVNGGYRLIVSKDGAEVRGIQRTTDDKVPTNILVIKKFKDPIEAVKWAEANLERSPEGAFPEPPGTISNLKIERKN